MFRTIPVLTALWLTACSSASTPAPAVELRPNPQSQRAASAAVESGSPIGIDWVFSQIAGYDGPLPSPPPPAGFIMTTEAGLLTGTTGCNRMSSGYDLDVAAGTLRFTKLRNTRMMCDRVAADTEEEVLRVMIATDAFRIRDGRLELWSKGSKLADLAATNSYNR